MRVNRALHIKGRNVIAAYYARKTMVGSPLGGERESLRQPNIPECRATGSVDNLCKKRRTKERHREKERERGGERKRGRKFLERIYILPHFAVLGTFDALQGAFGGYGSSRRTLNAARGPRVRAVF